MNFLTIENHMVAESTQPLYIPESRPIAFCGSCEDEIDQDDERVVENGAGTFCNPVCASKALYESTSTASGKAALMRFVAALTLLAEEDVVARAPELGWNRFATDTACYRSDDGRMQVAAIDNLRDQAIAILATLDVEGEAPWALKASEAALEFGEQLGKTV